MEKGPRGGNGGDICGEEGLGGVDIKKEGGREGREGLDWREVKNSVQVACGHCEPWVMR